MPSSNGGGESVLSVVSVGGAAVIQLYDKNQAYLSISTEISMTTNETKTTGKVYQEVC
jgi:hypothetical protein